MISRTTRKFRECLQNLPPEIREQARNAYKLFSQDPNHPGLQFKKVHTKQEIFAARISLDYRALCIRNGDTLIWFWVGKHTEYERVLKTL